MRLQAELSSPVAGTCCGLPEQPASSIDATPPIWTFRLGLGAALAGQLMVFGLGYSEAEAQGLGPAHGTTPYLVLHGGLILGTLAVMALLIPPLLAAQWAALRQRRLTLEALFLLSLAGAWAGSLISTFSGRGAVYYEVVAILLVIYRLGQAFKERQRGRIRRASEVFLERYAYAWVPGAGAERHRVPVTAIQPGTCVTVRPGEAVTVDGTILEGQSLIQAAALTGEALPRRCGPGDRIEAGSFVLDGELAVRAEGVSGQRTLDRIASTLSGAKARPLRMERLAQRLLNVFVPAVAAVSLLTGLVWGWLLDASWWQALFHAMAVLLVACPCALGLALPLAVWSGLWRLHREGLVARNASLLDALAEVDLIVFDKTGTLSEAALRVLDWELLPPARGREAWLASAVAAVEGRVEHPVARALAEQLPSDEDGPAVRVTDLRLLPGRGVEARVDGHRLRLVAPAAESTRGNVQGVAVFLDDEPVARARLKEAPRASVQALAGDLRALGLEAVVLTGDRQVDPGAWPGWTLSTGLSAEQKAAHVAGWARDGRRILYVGDGINDAAAMSLAAASIAPESATALAQETADGVLRGDALDVLVPALRLARRIRKSLATTLGFAAAYNVIGVALAALGYLHPVAAAVLMGLSSLTVTWRAWRSAEAALGPAPSSTAASEEDKQGLF